MRVAKQLDEIGDKLANVVEDFQKKQLSRNGRGRNRDRSDSRSRDNSRDNYRNGNSDNYYRNRSRDSRDNSRDRDRGRGEIGLIPEKEEETNQDLDQVKDTLTGMKSAVIATDLVIQYITVLNWRTMIGTVYRNSSSSTNNYICLSRSSPEDPVNLKFRSAHVLHGPMRA